MIQLKDICTKIGSGATPTGGKSSYLSQGISLIRSQNVLDYTFTMEGLAYINEDQAMKLNNVEVQEGDILDIERYTERESEFNQRYESLLDALDFRAC